MTDITDFNLGANTKAERKMLLCCANTGTSAAPVWEYLGYGVEESSIEFNLEETTKTDILGVTSTTLGKPQRRQSFEPCEIREGSDLQVMLYNILRHDSWSELSAFDLLIVHLYAGTTGAFEAERYPASAIIPASLGGSTTLDMPFEVVYGGKKALGTVAIASDGAVTFTPAA